LRFRDAFHGDKGDTILNTPTFNPLYRPAWWQAILNNPTGQLQAKNYQSPLSGDGAANNEYYRLPYSTLSGMGTFYLYVGPNLRKARYGTLTTQRFIWTSSPNDGVL